MAGPHGEPQLAVSVVVTVRDEARRLPILLSALRRQTLPRPRFEVIVVDDASRDGSAEIARSDPGVVVVSLPAHSGLPAGRNAGIAASRAPLLAFTDADCVPDPTWLERGVARIAATGVDMLAGGIAIPLGPRPSAAALVDAAINLDQAAYVAAGFGAGANLWLRRAVLGEVGTFDARLGTYGDEADLCRRATAAGATLVYAPDVLVSHPPRARARELARKSFLQGLGHAARRRSGATTARPLFRDPRAMLPRRRLPPADRPGEPPPARRPGDGLRLLATHYVLVRLPRVLGDLAGELRRCRRPGRHEPDVGSPAQIGEPGRLDRGRLR